MAEKSLKTKNKILRTALDLFNENGTVKITTNHIADAMGISPGNLYYHYRNKEEIIRTLWENMVKRIQVPFSEDTGPGQAGEILDFLVSFFGIMHEYRFFWFEIAVLIEKDPQLKDRYITRARSLLELYKRFVRKGSDNGFFRPDLNDDDLEQMVENTWFLSQYWALHTYIHEDEITPDKFKKGAARIVASIKPYLTDVSLSAMEEVLQDLSHL